MWMGSCRRWLETCSDSAELTPEEGVKEAAVWAERRSSGARSCGSHSAEEFSEAHWQGRTGRDNACEVRARK